MRIARRLVALAVMAMAVMALAASTALAQGTPTIEVRSEPGGAHIPTGVNAPLHAEGEVALFGHVFGIEAQASDCHLEFEGHVNEDGEGEIEHATFTDHIGQNDCTRDPCPPGAGPMPDSSEMMKWPVHVDYVGSGIFQLTAEFCIVPTGQATEESNNRCLVTTTITGSNHDYEIAYNDTAGVLHAGPRCEITGQVHLETDEFHPAIELVPGAN